MNLRAKNQLRDPDKSIYYIRTSTNFQKLLKIILLTVLFQF